MSGRLRIWLAVLAGFGVFAGLVMLAALPTGADEPDGVVPEGTRLAGRAPVDDAWVLLLSDSGRLRVQVAYKATKGWLGVAVDHRSDEVVAARTETPGEGPIPALTAVFGRAPGDHVTVRWDDGEVDEIDTEPDGTYLVARGGQVASTSVVVTQSGERVIEVDGP